MKKQIKVAYFPSDTEKNKVLGSNGKSLDKYCIKCEPEEDLSTGNYVCDLAFLVDDNIQDLLQEEVILKIFMDYGNEIFRVSKVTVGTRYIYVVARQITIADSLTLWLEDVRPTNLNGQSAVTWLLDNAEGKKEIQIISDIDTIATAYYQRMSLYKALHDSDNSFINRWGGEVQRREYTIYINKRIGIDRGFTIREGKNLIGFESTSNIDNLVTRAIGQGYNGILGNYIDSPLIGSYNRIYTSVIKYDDIKVKDEYSEEGYDTLEQAQAELDRRIGEEFSKNDIDKIKASYTINFVQLEKTEEYKNYIVAEKLFIGDDCRVYIPKLNVDIKVRALSKKYDVLAQKTKEIKLSNYIEAKSLSIKQIVDKLESIDSTETILQLAKDNATSLIKGGLKNSYVIVRENEILIMDTKDINTATNVWRWNSGGLGHSSTGYYGTYGTAITQDGAIVASFITTGILNANLIRAGIIESLDKKTWINLETGDVQITGTVKSQRGYQYVSLDSGGITLQDHHKLEQMLRIATSYFSSNRDFNGTTFAMPQFADFLRISHIEKSDLTDGWSETDIQNIFMDIWTNTQKVGNTLYKKGITFYEPLFIKNKVSFSHGTNHDGDIVSVNWLGIEGLLGVYGDNGSILGYKSGESYKAAIAVTEESVSGDNINTWGNVNCNGGRYHNGFFIGNHANAYSNSITRSYSETNCIETEEKQVRFIFENVEIKNGKAILNIPKRYLYISNGYIISSIIKKGKGNVWIGKEEDNRFIIEADDDIKVNIEIIIKMSDYTNPIQENTNNGEYHVRKNN